MALDVNGDLDQCLWLLGDGWHRKNTNHGVLYIVHTAVRVTISVATDHVWARRQKASPF